MNYKKGFTLIELLVVIAIIGLLSSVVLASLRSAGNKGGNAAVKSNLNNMRAQAALYYEGNNNSYMAVCTTATPPGILGMYNKAVEAGGSGVPSCANTASAWAASVPLKTAEGTNNYWCVDWTGASKGHPNATAASTCP